MPRREGDLYYWRRAQLPPSRGTVIVASFYPRSDKREQRTRVIGVTLAALGLHAGVLSVIEPPRVDPWVAAQLRAASDLDPEGEAPVLEFEDNLVDLDCQGAVTLRALGRVGVCEFWGRGDDCRERAFSRYRIEAVGCRTPLETPELAEITPTPILEADIVSLPPLEELIDPPAPDEPPEPEVERDEPVRPDGKVVEIAKPELEIRPDKSDYLAEFDSKVEKETVKRGRPDGGRPTPPPRPPVEEAAAGEASDETPPGAATPPSAAPGKAGAPGAMSMRAEPRPTAPVGESFGIGTVGPDGAAPRLGRAAEASPSVAEGGERGENGGGGQPAPRLSPRALQPSAETLGKIVAQGSDDYLPGVEEGDGTALNARRWKHASFFNRVKGQLRQTWEPGKAYRLRDPRGNIYGFKDRLTIVTVSLKPDGSLNNVWVVQPSGVDFLDDVAVEAVREAHPFPNPPDALVDEESRLITFQFGFMFQVNNRAGWKVFRYR